MKAEELKLYNKYYNVNNPNKKLIYIGIDNEGEYLFIYKDKDYNININFLNNYDLNSKQIIKDLNLKTFIYKNGDEYIGDEYIEGYSWCCFDKKDLINLKPILKDKLKNIINR